MFSVKHSEVYSINVDLIANSELQCLDIILFCTIVNIFAKSGWMSDRSHKFGKKRLLILLYLYSYSDGKLNLSKTISTIKYQHKI